MEEYANLTGALVLQHLRSAIQDFAAFIRVGCIDIEKLGTTVEGLDLMHNPLYIRKRCTPIKMHPEDIQPALGQGQTGSLAKSTGSPKNQGPISHKSSVMELYSDYG
jgi:hypothetical protein